MTQRDRVAWIAALAGVLAFLVFASNPRQVGDGGEYLAVAQTIADGRLPFYTDASLASAVERLHAEPGYRTTAIRTMARTPDGSLVPAHPWTYPALAAPGVGIADAIGLHPNYGFAALNVVLLLLAAWVLWPRVGAAFTVLLALSPIVWWIDKAHTELFTYALLAIGFALLRDRPWWALIAVGLAATQSVVVAGAIPVVWLAAIAADRERLRDPRMYAAGAIAAGLAVAMPCLYVAVMGTPSPMLQVADAAEPHLPSLLELSTTITDLNQGLLFGMPLLVLIVAGALIIARRSLPWPELAAAAACAAIFLYAFSQVGNLNSGGTPGMSRYALWLVPLAVPALAAAHRARPQLDLRVAVPVVASVVLALVAYWPGNVENYRRPSPLASAVWEHAPGLDNPLPEIFFERVSGREARLEPVANADCSKVLVVDGGWPAACPAPPVVPCDLCYANRSGSAYEWADAVRR